MGTFAIGALSGTPASERPDLLATPTQAALANLGLLDLVGVVEIDPAVSDTATTQKTFGLDAGSLANCVVVGGKREGTERLAACVVLSSTRADVNGVVRRYLDVRKASFLPMERAVTLTGMEYGGITPIGLPTDWPLLVDRRVTGRPMVVIGSGVRRSKILLPGDLLARLPAAEVLDGLGL
ncbi:MAG TPA: YbaK/EbsC family protein [Acidimicrobiales bacterium]|nr:YbaK/EbsC family protein [Acidimicrobiales bacterium]